SSMSTIFPYTTLFRSHIDAELALGVFDAGVGLSCRHMHAFGKQLEVVDKVFHAGLHAFAAGRCNLVVVDDDRAGVVAQPLDALRSEEHTSELQSRENL